MFPDYAVVQDDCPVGNAADHTQIVGNKQHCKTVVASQFVNQIQD